MSALETCPCCEDLAPRGDADNTRKFSDIAESAAKGCESCALIQHAVHDCVPEALVSQEAQQQVEVVIRQAIMRNFVELVVRWDNDRSTILDLFVHANTFSPWPSLRVGTATSGNSISRDSFAMVESWLRGCLGNHGACVANTRSTLPTRVLDLHSVQPNVVLCEPKNKGEKYVCLSHCWGDSRGITTTMDNVGAFNNAIVFGSLPRTFQEAIIFTRKLGVQYLWIDSLCIVQDSEDDWQTQSALMSSIYANSYVTLAATGSESDDGGLFFRHPKATVTGISRMGVEYKVHARPVIDHMDDAHFPLFKRAWVYQERLLAPRVLHFGRQELWWECLESVACECGDIFGERYGTGQEKFLSKLTHQQALSKSDLKHIRRRWHAIVEEYSQLLLTKMRDRLPALSGIAEQMKGLRDGSYLAGLWSDTLIEDLLWYRPDSMTGQLTDKWRAPSWSWATLEGPVRYFDAPYVQETPDLNTNLDSVPTLSYIYISNGEKAVRVATENQFGEVIAGHLRLHGPLVSVTVFDTRSSSSRSLQRRRQIIRRQTLRSAQYEFRFEEFDNPNPYPFFADYDLQKQDARFADAIYSALRVATDDSGDEYAILLKCIHEEQGIWERIGLFTTKFSRMSSDHMELYGTAFAGKAATAEFTLV